MDQLWYDELFEKMEQSADRHQAEKMSAYMKNQFPFLGLPKPELTKIMKPFLVEMRKEKLDWSFVNLCWEKDYREAQYAGVAYLMQHKKELVAGDIDHLKELVTTKSWWEVTDSLDELVGIIVEKNPQLKKQMLQWSTEENIWVRRTAIDFQQKWKENTDSELLKQIIMNNLGSKEFFINKAIGWSLREYSKVSPDWVKHFLDEFKNELAPLSIREAGKLYINKLLKGDNKSLC